MGVVIVIEVDPGSLGAAGLNSVGPHRQLLFGIVMPIPALGPVQANIDLIGCLDEFIW
jgi:hypothetical protein